MALGTSVFLALVASLTVTAQHVAAPYAQCGGVGWTGETACPAQYGCQTLNDWYHQCLPSDTATNPPSDAPPAPASIPVDPLSDIPMNVTRAEVPYGNLVTACTVAKTVAITFDDGPYTWTSALIDSLDRAGVKATFFVVGRMYGCIYDYADVLKKAYASGHQIASHTWTHANLSGGSQSTVTNEMTQVETALKKILGIRPKWFRPPYGAQNANLLNYMRTLRYKTVTWNLDTEDWNNVGVARSQSKFTALNSNPDPRIIPLAHDALQSTAQQLGPWIANWAKERGLRAVTLSECLGEPIPGGQYDMVGGAGPRDNTWRC